LGGAYLGRFLGSLGGIVAKKYVETRSRMSSRRLAISNTIWQASRPDVRLTATLSTRMLMLGREPICRKGQLSSCDPAKDARKTVIVG